MTPEIKAFIDSQILLHIHDGNLAQQIIFQNLFGYSEPVSVQQDEIAITGDQDAYLMAPRTMTLQEVYFAGADDLATSNTNYITWTITNKGQTGSGTAAMLASGNTNTTKATGGSALTANSKRQLTLSTTPSNLEVIQGDRIRIRASVTGTLSTSITFPTYLFIFR